VCVGDRQLQHLSLHCHYHSCLNHLRHPGGYLSTLTSCLLHLWLSNQSKREVLLSRSVCVRPRWKTFAGEHQGFRSSPPKPFPMSPHCRVCMLHIVSQSGAVCRSREFKVLTMKQSCESVTASLTLVKDDYDLESIIPLKILLNEGKIKIGRGSATIQVDVLLAIK
jgi:hypothetical protein